MKLTDLLVALATKAGAQAQQVNETISAHPELGSVELADDFAQAIDRGLMNLEGAKQNGDVLRHYQPVILKAIDERLEARAHDLGLDAEMAQERSTYKRLDMLIARSRESLEKAERKTQPEAEQTRKLTETIARLQAEQTEAARAREAEIAELNARHEQAVTDLLIRTELGSKPYALSGQLSDESLRTLAGIEVNRELRERGIVVVNDHGTLRLKQKDNPVLDYLDEGNRPVTFSGLTDQILASKKLLRTNEEEQKTVPAAPQKVTVAGAGRNAELDAAVSEALGDIQ